MKNNLITIHAMESNGIFYTAILVNADTTTVLLSVARSRDILDFIDDPNRMSGFAAHMYVTCVDMFKGAGVTPPPQTQGIRYILGGDRGFMHLLNEYALSYVGEGDLTLLRSDMKGAPQYIPTEPNIRFDDQYLRHRNTLFPVEYNMLRVRF